MQRFSRARVSLPRMAMIVLIDTVSRVLFEVGTPIMCIEVISDKVCCVRNKRCSADERKCSVCVVLLPSHVLLLRESRH